MSKINDCYRQCRYYCFLTKEWVRLIVKYSFEPLKLDIHATEHCNLNCRGCTHFSPVAEREFCDLEQLDTNLKTLSRFQSSFGQLQILGGEPLLHPDIVKMTAIMRKYFPKQRITIITNGVLLAQPDKLPADFWQAIRENNIVIKLSQYPINVDYAAVEELCRQQNVSYEIFADRSENARGWNKFLLDENGGGIKALKYKVFKLLGCRLKNCFQLSGNRIYPCSEVAYVHHLNKAFGTNFIHRKGDYIEVDKIRNSFQIRKLMLFTTPFCSYCCGYVKDKWGISKREKSEWIR